MIDDAEIAQRIASFPDWHYDFDLRGQRTRPSGVPDKPGLVPPISWSR